MIGTKNSRRCIVHRLSFAAAALFALAAGSGRPAQAMSPGAMPAAQSSFDVMTIQMRGPHGGGGGGGYHGGGGGFHAAPAFRGGGFRAGAFHARPAFHGGGVRYGGGYHRGFAYRPHFHHHRRFYGAYYYPDDSYYYSYPHHRRCRVILTHYGPRRVCHYRPLHRWHHWRHRHHHHRYW
jgi:hypothetical protein